MPLPQDIEIKVLVDGVKERRYWLACSDALFAALLLAMIALQPYTPAIDHLDVGIVAGLLISFVIAFGYLYFSGQQNTYFQFRLTTTLAAIGGSLLMANALFGSHANLLQFGLIPWLTVYGGVLVAYFFAFLSFRDAVLSTSVFCGANFGLCLIYQLTLPEQTTLGLGATIATTGAVTAVLLHTGLVMRIQSSVHGTSMRSLEAQKAALAAEQAQLETLAKTDTATGLLNAFATRAALQASLSKPGVVHLMMMQMSDFDHQRQTREPGAFNALLKELTDVAQIELTNSTLAGRIHEDSWLYWHSAEFGPSYADTMAQLRNCIVPPAGCGSFPHMTYACLSHTIDAHASSAVAEAAQDQILMQLQGSQA